jgi:hypothetical protein
MLELVFRLRRDFKLKCYNKGGLVLCRCSHTGTGDQGTVVGNATFTYVGRALLSASGLERLLEGSINIEEIISYGEFEERVRSEYDEQDLLVPLN